MRSPKQLLWLAPALALLVAGNSGCFLHHHANTNPLAAVKSNQPDKALFDSAMADLDKGKYTVARLNLETLLNAYPDSEYLARAKMGIADSWYREGGIEGMAQAEAQYKDFITFFPAMKEASEAQLKVATIHYRQLQKPDRDPTEANRAQAELRTFLINYPDSPLRNQAVQMLRDTQEVLAEREYRIGQFYLERALGGESSDYRPGQSRLEEMLAHYPLYSQGDAVLNELAHSYLTTSRLYAGAASLETTTQSKRLYLANADADRDKAIADFQQLIVRYPLSSEAKEADRQLSLLKAPIPKPTEEAIAFNRQEVAGRGTATKSQGITGRFDFNGLLSTRPKDEIARADKVGEPALSQPQLAQDPPPPGLDQLIHDTMVTTGALKANDPLNAKISAELTAPKPGQPLPAAQVNAGKPLAFANVPDKPQGADTPETNAPQAVTGSNENDPNARRAASPDNPNMVLTPDEIDLQNREQILAAEVHRAVPATVPELRKSLQRNAAAQAAAMAKMKKLAAKAKAAPSSPPPAPEASSPPPAKKGFFSHIWP